MCFIRFIPITLNQRKGMIRTSSAALHTVICGSSHIDLSGQQQINGFVNASQPTIMRMP